VNVASQKLFSCSGLATNEDWDVALSRVLSQLQRLTNLRIIADEIRLNADSVATVVVFAGQFDSHQHVGRTRQIRSQEIISTPPAISYLAGIMNSRLS
jgi:hypothetical protein